MAAIKNYEVRAKLIKKQNEVGGYDFIEIQKDFTNREPIKAREEALSHYQSIIDVLLESKGLKYESDRQAREKLDSFIDPKTTRKFKIGDIEFDIANSIGNGVGVFCATEDEEEFMIHGIGAYLMGSDKPESLLSSLELEHELYEKNGYSKDDSEVEIVFCDSNEWAEGYRENEPGKYTILKTPFDWEGMDKPYWWGDQVMEDEVEYAVEPRLSMEDVIAKGESNQIEFKPSLLYNFKTQSASIGVKGIIAKTISAFLNTNGGFLLIGVNDDKNIVGLDYDFSLANGKEKRDYFLLEFDDMLKQFIPNFATTNINGDFYNVNERDIFVVTVFPSKSRPVFMKGQFGKEFWVRWTASTRQYTDIEDISTYCLEHWRSAGKFD
jgi:hypothetical protein